MERLNRPIKALSMHIQKPLGVITLKEMAPSPYIMIVSICHVNMNIFARLDEIPP